MPTPALPRVSEYLDICRVAAADFCGISSSRSVCPASVLATYSMINVALVAVTMGGGKTGLYAMFASFFFISVGFPTIFALGIHILGEHTKLGSSLIVMSIVGGAIAPPFTGDDDLRRPILNRRSTT
jgi:FHS family L-fucose permease-like MFS transporter